MSLQKIANLGLAIMIGISAAKGRAQSMMKPQGTPKEVVKGFIDIVRSGKDPERAAEFLATSVKAHQMNAEKAETVVRSPRDYSDHVREFLRLYGPFEFEITELLADGDKVYVRWKQTGRHLSEIDGFAPTGKPLIEIAS